MYKSLLYIICIARVFDDHRSCQKLINYITNKKAISMNRFFFTLQVHSLKKYFYQKQPRVDDDAQLQVMIIIIVI
jgi:hypothetical protein